MSSAINHKARSRRGYKMQRSVLAPKHSPLIGNTMKEQRRAFRERMAKLFRNMARRKEG